MGFKHRLRAGFKRFMLRVMSIYPPYLGAGIRVKHLGPGRFRVRMKLRWYNQNYYGTHFGGSLYSMCDPFFVLALVERLGPGYEAWDKAATIRFLRPGRGTVTAEFDIPDQRVEEIRRQVDREGRLQPEFAVEVTDPAGDAVARIEKVVSVRKREPRRSPAAG